MPKPNSDKKIIGKQFRNLYVIKFHGMSKNSQRTYLCRCNCGRELIKTRAEIVKGKTENCRKCFDEQSIGSIHKNWNGFGYITGVFWAQIKLSAKKRKYELTISIEYIDSLIKHQEFKCALSGLPINIAQNIREKGKTTASLDRINPSIGYVDGNVQWVHKDINWMKQDYTQEEFINYCRMVTNNNDATRTNKKL